MEGDVALVSLQRKQAAKQWLWTSLLTLLNLAFDVQALLAPGHVTAVPTERKVLPESRRASLIASTGCSLNKMMPLLQPVGQTPILQGQGERKEERRAFLFAERRAEGECLLSPLWEGDFTSRGALMFALGPSPSCVHRFPGQGPVGRGRQTSPPTQGYLVHGKRQLWMQHRIHHREERCPYAFI